MRQLEEKITKKLLRFLNWLCRERGRKGRNIDVRVIQALLPPACRPYLCPLTSKYLWFSRGSIFFFSTIIFLLEKQGPRGNVIAVVSFCCCLFLVRGYTYIAAGQVLQQAGSLMWISRHPYLAAIHTLGPKNLYRKRVFSVVRHSWLDLSQTQSMQKMRAVQCA